MVLNYKLVGADPRTGEAANVIIRTTDGAQIPKAPGNTDYQEYLEWVAAGNTAEAAD
jgi:hypothetical protein